jgi:hypothetical protein
VRFYCCWKSADAQAARTRGIAAIAAAAAFLAWVVPAGVPAADEDRQDQLALSLLNGQSCAQRYAQDPATDGPATVAQATATPQGSPAPSASPAPAQTPGLPGVPAGVGNGTYTLNPSPRPRPGQTPAVTPPPIPTATPNPTVSTEPIFLVRGGETPPPIPPAGQATPEPTPEPTGVPTLAPGFVAVIADTWSGNRARGQPSDAVGNVHIYYADEEIVGDKAHYDGNRTITITGHPFLVNHEHNSVLTGDVIVFDTVAQTAKLTNGKGASDEGVQRGLVHFSASDLHTDPDGTAHGLNPYVTTCENPRGGYHITGKDMEVYPGDKIVIHKAVLWLGLAAIFYLPLLIIPLRTVENQHARARWFPEVGYDSYEGAWIKIQIPFGKDQYYYGYYIVNYFTKLGLGLGYVGFYSSKKGRRSVSVNIYTINNQTGGGRQSNLAIAEQENFSQHLRGNFQFNYQSNYGPLVSIPPNESISEAIVHQTAQTSQNYSFSHSSVGGQSSSNSFTFSDTRQFNQNLNQTTTYNISDSNASFGGFTSFNNQSEFDYLMQYTTAGADYQMEFDKIYSQQAAGINKIPEFQVRPSDFFQHFVIPLSAQLTVGEYSEPAGTGEPQSLATWRGDANLVAGPLEAKVLGSDFEGTVTVDQYAYGTGDLKAAIQQDLSLTTPINSHMVNTLTYNEANYNGPALVPFQYLDQQPTMNTKNAQDMLRIFNDDVYALSLGWATNFDGVAQPLSYQITAKPSPRSVVLLSGSFIPGPGMGFETTNLQLSTPFGRDASLQFVTNINWRPSLGLGQFFSDKIIYYTRTIGNCYQLLVLYNESQQAINVGLNLLAFPTQTAVFQIGSPQPVVPTTFNF